MSLATRNRKSKAKSSNSSPPTPSKSDVSADLPRSELTALRKDIIRLSQEKQQVSDALHTIASQQDFDSLLQRTNDLQRNVNSQIAMFQQELTAMSAISHQKQTDLEHSKDHRKGKRKLRKLFQWRESRLVTMLNQTPEYRTIYNIMFAVLVLFTIKTLINEYYDSSLFKMSMLRWNFGAVLTHVLPMWLAMFAVHFLSVPFMWFWRKGYYGNKIYIILYASLQLVFWGIFAPAIAFCGLPIASAMICLCEQVRMGMKMHSFFRETYRIRASKNITKKKAKVDDDDDEKKMQEELDEHDADDILGNNYTLLSNFQEQVDAFLLFHFVPTLIYRNNYPRSGPIRWKFVFQRFGESVACLFYTYTVFKSFCIPEFEKSAQDPTNTRQLIISIFNSMLPSIVVYMMAFFGVLHAWFNAWGELTRFGDRLFYHDWWNCKGYDTYYRKWNIVVHDWCFNYIYVDVVRNLGAARIVGMFLTFIFSAIIHEYILALGLGFFYPAMLVMFLGMGVGYIFLSKLISSNFFFWINLIIGNGILMVMYSREWYARNYDYAHQTDGGGHLSVELAFPWFPLSWVHYLKGPM